MNRRVMLKTVALAGVSAAQTKISEAMGEERGSSGSPGNETLQNSVLRYLASHNRADGGFAWEDQENSHLTPTFAAVGCYYALQQPPPNKNLLAHFIRKHHPSQLKKLEQEHRVFDYQQVQSLAWLGERTSDFREIVTEMRRPVAYLKQYEQHGYPVFQSDMAAILCRPLVGLSPGDLGPQWSEFIDSRRRPNGSFNNTPAAEGGDGHVMNTWWGLQAIGAMGRAHSLQTETISWLRDCQLPSGGFTYAPKPEFGGVDDAEYTWSAIRALKLLGATPARRDACISFLYSLANVDGGFADRPGWLSSPLATYYVLDALDALGELKNASAVVPISGAARRAARINRLNSNLKVFTVQIQAPGQGSPSDAVDLASTLKVHLWGAKNAKPAWVARAQAIADSRKTPVTFFVANEEYGTWLNVPGLGTYSHTSDVIAPAGSDLGPPQNSEPVSWLEYRNRRLTPLLEAGGRLIWQFGENEELVRMLLDDSLERGGFAAISTFHFGNPDFTNSEPFLQRWRGQIPFVALQDAHAEESWWACDLLAGFRTFFLAAEPTWREWLRALKNNWTVAVRHDAASGDQTWMHAGSHEVLEFVRAREAEWRWWSSPRAIERPRFTCAVLNEGDPFEAGAPERSGVLRIRCRWDCTVHGVLKTPLVELKRLTLDGTELSLLPVERKNNRGQRTDHYYLAKLPPVTVGQATATATLRRVIDGSESVKEFRLDIRPDSAKSQGM